MAASHPSALQYGTVSVDPASIAATTRLGIDVTITGLAVGDLLVMHPPVGLHDDLVLHGWRVKDDDTATIFLYNPTAGAIDDPAQTWEYEWWDRT
jgi:hypothetical protein